ncbi:MAG: radical SAM protein [Desulfobacterales bacterium]|jgi:radical SAM protein with 4Fe4S-binding SPASM domain
MSGCFNSLIDFTIPRQAVSKALDDGRLLSMEIEFSLKCNFSCPYCYVPRQDELKGELTPAEHRDIILQAKALGAERIIVLGGEPSIYPEIDDMIRFMVSLGLSVELFTNGTGISPPFAGFLHRHRVRVVLKMNTFDPDLQDRLSGKTGAYQIIQAALSHLKQAGYPSDEAFLAVSSVICRQNIAELPRLWRWLRDQNIAPYFEIMTPQENAVNNRWLSVDSKALYHLFETLSDIDRRHYGRQWDPQPPLVGNRCMRHSFSCLVTSKGDVMPCVGVTISLGNVREAPLSDIIKNSTVLNHLKNHRNTIKGGCGTCEKADLCYGCRGAAYQLTGDYLASDPLCWRNSCPSTSPAGGGDPWSRKRRRPSPKS